jgi:hypothetical protein
MPIKIKLKKNDQIREVLPPNVIVAIVPLKVDFESETGFFENIGITCGEIVSDFPSLPRNPDGFVYPYKSFIIKHIPSFGCVKKISPNSFGKFQDFQKGDFIYYATIEFMDVM